MADTHDNLAGDAADIEASEAALLEASIVATRARIAAIQQDSGNVCEFLIKLLD